MDPDQTGPVSSTNVQSADVVVVSKPSIPLDLANCLKSAAEASYQQNIHEFLAKPIVLTQGDFVGTIPLIDFDLLSTLLLKAPWRDKLRGYLAIRATIVVRLQLNANKFQQGRLIMGYIPAGKDNFLRETLTALTQLPHVELDINSETAAVLEIPYTSPYTHFNLIDGTGESASLLVREYAPFKFGAGSSVCGYTIWCSLKDVELVTPVTNVGWIAQSGKIPRKTNIKDTELKTMTQGPISGMLNKISSAATVLGDIPLISSYAGTLAWVSAIGARVATVFGYSQPRNENLVTKNNRSKYSYENTADGVDNCDTLGLSATNAVSILPGLGATNLDEMSLQYLQQVPAYFKTNVWRTVDNYGDVIDAISLRPDQFAITSIVPGASDMTPVAFLANMFRYYRGSLKVTVKLSKTQFHSGRLIVSFNPGSNPGGVYAIEDSDYIFREIIDVRDATEYTFLVPFVATQPYLGTDESYGLLTVHVLNPLVAPDTVSSEVDLLFEISAHHDMEWSLPKEFRFSPTTFYAQSGVGANMEELVHKDKCLGPSSPTVHLGADVASLCIGEKIMSVKQLMNRLNYKIENWGLSRVFRPFDTYPSFKGSLGLFTPSTNNDYITVFASCYRYNRGSVNIKSTNRFAQAVHCVLSYNDTNAPLPALATKKFMSSSITNDSTIAHMGINVPMYHKYHTRTSSCRTGPSSRFLTPHTSPIVTNWSHTNNDDNAIFGRYAGDDYQLGFFIGIPPMTIIDT